jgi:hypothetical protein
MAKVEASLPFFAKQGYKEINRMLKLKDKYFAQD